jgi:hypothetical protein
MSVNCDNPQTQEQRDYCNCQEAITKSIEAMDKYNEALIKFNADEASFNRWSSKHGEWQRREGEFDKFKFHGVSQDFNVMWGWADWDTNNACRECANNQRGWGEGSKFGSGAWCSGQSGKLLGANGYSDSGAWGWHVAGSRKWWTCTKSQSQKEAETREYNNAEPLFDPEDTAKTKNWKVAGPPQRPALPSIGDIVCCSQIFSEIDVTQGNISFDNITQSCGITKTESAPSGTGISAPSDTGISAPSGTGISAPSGTGASDPVKKEDDNTNQIIIGGLSSSFVSCSSLIIIGLLLYTSRI